MANPVRWLGQQIVGAITKRIDDNLRKTGEIAAAHARAYAPIKTGALRAGIGYRVENRTLTLYGTARHTIFQDRGTRYIHGHFFLERGLADAGKLVWGSSLSIAYPNTPTYSRPIYAHRGGYVLPGNLTRGQRKHVAEHLLPKARHYYRHNKARLRVGGG